MTKLVLPTVRVGFINVNWSNGSRVKPSNPIPREIIDNFELKEDYKINWISDITGLITLQGNYNYLVFNENDYYFLEKTRVIDIGKLVYVYTLTKDIHQYFLTRTDGYIKGYLIKTNNENVLWSNIQTTKGVISEVNEERVLYFCKETDCKATSLGTEMKVIEFQKDDKNDINQFKHKYRLSAPNFKTFKNKLKNEYTTIDKEPNQIFSVCKLVSETNWENYIAKLVESYLKTDVLNLNISSATNLASKSPKLNTHILKEFGQEIIYIITKTKRTGDRVAFETILESKEAQGKVIKQLDLSQVNQIRLLDIQKFEQIIPLNRSIFNMSNIASNISQTDKSPLYLKGKMYGANNTDIKHYKNLPIANKIYTKNYSLNDELLTKFNLSSIQPIYKKHGLVFSNNYVPALYYPSFKDAISNKELLKLIDDGNYCTEIGYLLNNIANYEDTCHKNISNKHVYKAGKPINITTGIKFIEPKVNCQIVKKLSDSSVIENKTKQVLYSDVFKDDIEESFWLSLINSYLWWGELDRTFVGLGVGLIDNQFKTTYPECHVTEDDEVWTYEKLSLTDNNENSDKLPTYDKLIIDPSTEKQQFKDSLNLLKKRRDNIQIIERVFDIDITEGDIYWCNFSYGLFPKENGEFIADKEFKTIEPCLVVYLDSFYTFKKQITLTYNSINQAAFGYKFGVLTNQKPNLKRTDKNNLILNNEENPEIYSIKSLLEQPKFDWQTIEYEKFETALQKFFKLEITTRDAVAYQLPQYWNKYQNYVWLYDWIKSRSEYIYLDYFEIHTHWPKTKNGKYALIEDVYYYKDQKWLGIKLEEHNLIRLETRSSVPIPRWSSYIKEKLIKHIFYSNPVSTKSDTASWATLTEISEALLPDKKTFESVDYKKFKEQFSDRNVNSAHEKGILSRLITDLYRNINNEEISDSSYKYCYIDEAYLKQKDATTNQPKLHLFSFDRNEKPYFYVLLMWDANKKTPTIEIICADPSIVEDQPDKSYVLLKTSTSINNNLVQVINQQNTLYVHGHTFPLITKMVTNDGNVDYTLRVENLKIADTISTTYRVYFKGSGGDLIKTNITVINKDTSRTLGQTNLSDLINLKIDLVQQQERRKLEILQQRETNRVANLNIRNQSDDLAWEKAMRPFATASSALSLGVAAGVSALTNPAAAFLGLGSSVSNLVVQEFKTTQNLQIQERSILQQTISTAFQIEQQKNIIDTDHKASEMRERNRIIDMTNNIVNPIPNDANILEAVNTKDTGGQSIVIFNKIPEGRLLKHLTDYHLNYGFDIVLNDFQLNVKDLQEYDNQIYQFGRIDEISVDDLSIKESIKNSFLSGVYLKKHKYKLNNITYAQQKEQHNIKIAAKNEEERAEKNTSENKRLAEIAAAARGVEEAKAEYRRMSRNYNNYKNLYETITQEKESLEREYEECVKKLDNYGVHIEEEIEKMKKEHAAETEIHIQEKIEEGIRAKTQQLEEEKTRLIKDKERIEKEKKQIELQQAQIVTQLNQTLDELDECKKSSEDVSRLRATYNTLVDAHQVTTRELEETKNKLKVCEENLKKDEERIKTPEEQAREYKVERTELSKGWVRKIIELNNLIIEDFWKILDELNDSSSYLKFFDTGAYEYGNTFTYEKTKTYYSDTYKARIYRNKKEWDDKGFWSYHVKILDKKFTNIFNWLIYLESIHIHSFEGNYFGFVIKNDAYHTGNFGIFSNSKPGVFLYYLNRIIHYLEEIKEIAAKIKQFFVTDNTLAEHLYPAFLNDNNLKKVFIDFDFTVNTVNKY